jgi:hypothetical protein
MNDASGNGAGEPVAAAGPVCQHVRSMLAKLRSKLLEAKTSVDYTVEVDRKKNRSGGVDGV